MRLAPSRFSGMVGNGRKLGSRCWPMARSMLDGQTAVYWHRGSNLRRHTYEAAGGSTGSLAQIVDKR